MFLLQSWDKELNYSDQAVSDACSKEQMFKNFFGAVKDLLRRDYLQHPIGYRNPKKDRELMMKIVDTKDAVHKAFCNNFDTVAVLKELADLVRTVNNYLADPVTGTKPSVLAVQKAALYITQILRVLGVVKGEHRIGFALDGNEGGADKETILTPYLDTLNTFRSNIRTVARNTKDAKQMANAILTACDEVRDDVLPKLGVRLEDMQDETRWKLDDPQILLAEIAKKREAERAKIAKKRAKTTKNLKKEITEATTVLRNGDPADFFKAQKDKYSEFDADGLPIKDANGDDLKKNAKKKCAKLRATMIKKWNKYSIDGSIEKFIAQKEAALKVLEDS
jgi:cysteinyl-tRNA synthetase